jgi:hypothetical protein
VQPAQTVTAALHGHHVAQHGKVGCDFGRAPGRLPSATCDGRSVGDAFSLTVRPGAECLQGAGRSGRAVPREA